MVADTPRDAYNIEVSSINALDESGDSIATVGIRR